VGAADGVGRDDVDPDIRRERRRPGRHAHELHIIEQGTTDADASTSIYVPSIDLVVGGDVFYNQCHMMVAASTPESRANWIADLDRLTALNPKTAVAGHKKVGVPDTRTRSRAPSGTSSTSGG
jgi:hypothetical protein